MNLFEKDDAKLLVEALISLKTEDECKKFLSDLMTTKEILDMSQRIMVAKLLSEKNIYSKIEEETGASSATICRVNRCYRYGDGGYAAVLEKIGEKK
ncbi:MAG: YerC/YecD family TrpR-related protein [Bacillota bacterium]|nr:YerC/YecD family TrpR-related protein [Bacillota bacterium]